MTPLRMIAITFCSFALGLSVSSLAMLASGERVVPRPAIALVAAMGCYAVSYGAARKGGLL